MFVFLVVLPVAAPMVGMEVWDLESMLEAKPASGMADGLKHLLAFNFSKIYLLINNNHLLVLDNV